MGGETINIHGIRCIVLECGTCGIPFAVPESKYNAAYNEGGYFSCSNGHARGWQKGHDEEEKNKLRLERDRLKQQIAQKDDEIRDAKRVAIANAERAAAETKRANRIKRRAEAALCPCCNRSFSQLARHMKSKHPNVVPLAQKQA